MMNMRLSMTYPDIGNKLFLDPSPGLLFPQIISCFIDKLPHMLLNLRKIHGELVTVATGYF